MFHTHAITVPVGSWHPAGSPIAEVGNSGTQAAHLHLEEHAGGWSNPVDFTADAYEVIDAGRWPGYVEDEFTDDDMNRLMAGVGELIDHRWQQMATPNVLWKDGDDVLFEVLVDGDGHRVRRVLGPGELLALRLGNTITEEPIVDVSKMAPAQQAAVRDWRMV
jgi:murein DD-endopeptidase MepM/ murein hydrolase activator NlpD